MRITIFLTIILFSMTSNSFSQSSTKTYILVHGAGHGSWSWKKLVPIMESAGYKIISLDLPGSSNDTARLSTLTFADDVKAIVDAATKVSGQVILLGHSSGGVAIAQAAEALGPKKVAKLVFLDAFMPKSGESVMSLADKTRAGLQPASTENSGGGDFNPFIFTADHKSAKWKPELAEQLFYHDCKPEDIAFAKAHITWQALASLATPTQLTDENYGSIKKYYILCTEAKDLDKSAIVTNVHCEKVYKLPSSHSPFLSMPEKLVEILIEISK